ncbi:MAG: hypothetical protein R2695_08515 [Acidimicrobiales bacterium]
MNSNATAIFCFAAANVGRRLTEPGLIEVPSPKMSWPSQAKLCQ